MISAILQAVINGTRAEIFVALQTAENCSIETSNCCTYKCDLITMGDNLLSLVQQKNLYWAERLSSVSKSVLFRNT